MDLVNIYDNFIYPLNDHQINVLRELFIKEIMKEAKIGNIAIKASNPVRLIVSYLHYDETHIPPEKKERTAIIKNEMI